jgi:hypothetical protein
MPARDTVYVDVVSDTKKSGTNMLKLAGIIGGVTAAVAGAVKIGKELIDTYKTQEQAELKLQAAINATGKASQFSMKEMKRYASSLQNLTIYGDEAILQAQGLLQGLANLDQEGLKSVTPAILDFASAMGVDLNTAASLVGKTLGSSTNALSRYGIELDATAPKEDKLIQLTEELNKKFGGTAEEIGNSATASFEQLGNAFGDLKEQGGRALAEALSPIADKLTDMIGKATTLTDEMNDVNEAFKKMAEGEELTDDDKLAIRAQSVKNLRKELEQVSEEYDWLAGMIEKAGRHATDEQKQQLRYYEELKKQLQGRIDLFDEEEGKATQLYGLMSGRAEMAKATKEAEEDITDELTAQQRIQQAYKDYWEQINDQWRSMGETFPIIRDQMSAIADTDEYSVEQKKRYLEQLKEQLALGPAMLEQASEFPKTDEARKKLLQEINALLLKQQEHSKDLAEDWTALEEPIVNAENQMDLIERSMSDFGKTVDDVADKIADWSDVVDSLNQGAQDMFGTFFEGFGQMLVDSEAGWEAIKEGMKDNFAATLRAIGEQALAMGALYLANPVTSYLAPGMFAVSAAAFAASGIIKSLARGGDFVTSGPELIQVGDNPGGRERVSVEPLDGGGGSGEVVIHNHVILDNREIDRYVTRASRDGRIKTYRGSIVS